MFLYFGSLVSAIQMYEGVYISEIEDIQILEISIIYVIVSNCNLMGFIGVLLLSISTLAFNYGALIMKGDMTVENTFFIFVIVALNSVKTNLQTRYHVQVFNTLQHIEKRKNEQNDLVSQLLPYHVYYSKFFYAVHYLHF